MAFHQRMRQRIIDRFMTFEPIGLITFGAIAGGLFLFLSLASEVSEGETHAFDDRILLSLRVPGDLGTPIGPYWLNHAVNDITALGGTTVLSLMTILATTYLLLGRRRAIAAFMFLSIVGGWIVSQLAKLGIARPRPDIVPHLVEVHDLSFPSGHAMLSAVTYLTLAALLSRAEQYRSTRIFLLGTGILLTLLIGLSRIYLGVHYPTDVLGGWCAGATWAAGCWLVSRRYISAKPSVPPQADVNSGP
ncbi:phosphatase PAP2 family protein [Neorhizobium lilium]|uniref:Phosphatase PAP2 family protein n=1 Tax=Neorhizobium lilium TaxID=2503024 RepID=A0A3S4UQ65_9HYPH|nr:phosphatase PAP2 family protein [Neorhizobium lilium]RWX78559.1 phosphatase PAP2 family protein [Neorhizobium lilium]